MPVYNGGNLIGGIYNRDSPISQVHNGSNIVFNANAIPNEWKYIEFEVQTSDGTFTIPFSSYGANGLDYNIRYYINGINRGSASGRVSSQNGTGEIVSNIPINEQVIIRIEPNGDDVNYGWGRAFGFYSNTSGCNSHVNKSKLRRIINDPDYAYLYTATSTGDSFRRFQYYDCDLLTSVPDESMPDDVTTIGTYFRMFQYGMCFSLTIPATESKMDNVTRINEYFRLSQYEGSGVTTTVPEEFPPNITFIPAFFRSNNYAACNDLLTPAAEAINNKVTDIGDYFRSAQYERCYSLQTAAEENMSDSIVRINAAFRQRQYYGTNITESAQEYPIDNVTFIGDSYRNSMYANCGILQMIHNEHEINANVNFDGNGYFRYNQFGSCPSLLIGNYVHCKRFPELIQLNGSSYQDMFRLNSQKDDADKVPEFLNEDGTTSPITEYTPIVNKYYLTNRYGIYGYADLNVNWK